jgi:hypothetical protein
MASTSFSSQLVPPTGFPQRPPALTVDAEPQQPNEGDGVIPALERMDTAVGLLDVAKHACGIPPARAAFGSVSGLLTMIRVHFPNLRH